MGISEANPLGKSVDCLPPVAEYVCTNNCRILDKKNSSHIPTFMAFYSQSSAKVGPTFSQQFFDYPDTMVCPV